MPEFLEKKLRAEYGDNPGAIYGTMNKLGYMRGNKETAKGREAERKHKRDHPKERSKGHSKGRGKREKRKKTTHEKKQMLRDLQEEK